MISELDEGIGQLMATLSELGLADNTLVFCLSDNGAASLSGEAGLFRGKKWLMYEGGIRVPWIVRWPARIPGGRVLSDPVIQLDILPTALAAAGVTPAPAWNLDGVNLLPLLEGKTEHLAPRNLYWRFGTQYAIRKGDWKLVKVRPNDPAMLIDLKRDPGEQQDLTAQFPEKASELHKLWNQWNATMQPPRWEGAWNPDIREQSKTKKKARVKKHGVPIETGKE
jgi:arylsulfatase A-like enzyme